MKEDVLPGRNKVFNDGEGRVGINLIQIGEYRFLLRLLEILEWEEELDCLKDME